MRYLFKRFLKIIALAYIYQLAKFGDFMSYGSKICSKMHPVSLTNTQHDVTDLLNHEMVKHTKTCISGERNIAFLKNKKILNLYLK